VAQGSEQGDERHRRVPLIAFAAILSLAVIIAAGVFLAGRLDDEPETASAERPCEAPEISDGAGGTWKCTFEDDFDGTEIDRGTWTAMTTETTGFSQMGECFVDDREHITVAHGLLTLTATKLPAAEPCGSTTSQYQSAMIFTEGKFFQTYGRFEARVRFPPGSGLVSAFWMWPEDDAAYGVKSGEIDVAEYFGAHPEFVYPHVHIKDGYGGDLGRGANCPVDAAAERFHDYAVEWSPTIGLRFLYDDVPCLSLPTWDPGTPLAFPQPFDRPFFLVFSVILGTNENAVSEATPFPARLEVDWVRAYAAEG
jgi:beta-glucanase (GH16 family)